MRFGKGRAAGCWLSFTLTACCYGGTLGFVAPSLGLQMVSLPGQQRAAFRFGAVMAPTSRPRALPCLFSSKEPPTPAGGMDIMDSLTGNERGMSTEEKIAALQREVQAQARLAESIMEEEGGAEGEKEDETVSPSVPAATSEPTDKISALLDSDVPEFIPPEGFVDEGKNILWPNPRRAAQLTLLAVVAQIAFVVYIITLNSFLNAVPTWFGKFVELIKSGDFKLPSL